MNAEAAQSVKFKVDRDVLADAVTWTTKSIPQRPAVPVLTGLLITANADGSVDLAVFDYEVSARARIAADVEVEGTILVSGRLLADIARALPPQPVVFELDGTKVSVTCGSSRFALMTMPVEEYPALPEVPETTGVISASDFQSAVGQVNIATSKDETLPILTAMRVEIEGDRVTLLATDRYRLAVREFTWNPRNPQVEAVALVRGKTMAEAAKAMSGDIEIALAESGGKEMLAFSSEGRVTTSLLVEGDYPKVRSLFPKDVAITAVLETSALREAVRRVSLVAERNSPIKFEFADGSLVLRAGAGDDAQATEALPATIEGEDITTGFNPGYIAEGLAQIDTPFVRFSLTEPKKPVVISGMTEADGEEDTSYRYLLMPILRF
ncbi:MULTISPECIES: DNA polymerase III subunit beta [Brevibacterium]|uniref:Beta sliding clamp n=1 Tax=Brevibacterium ravenspurgense TaxID=479117 RepID=A0A150H5V9_9MICO|nr:MULTISPECIES: DNA polymerase III subunit beta [Brevibacterium]KXZ57394.1 DNA polymerase III subunit beta [Brevibacterium ravenspurgense]MCG7300631.1 DNA polymerase III subunit beta [Brevibacterium ravenspurgense]